MTAQYLAGLRRSHGVAADQATAPYDFQPSNMDLSSQHETPDTMDLDTAPRKLPKVYIPRCHPWRHDSHLSQIRTYFYPQHATVVSESSPTLPDNRLSAISTVHLWRLRSPDTLPHAVYATMMLTDAILHDTEQRHTSDLALTSIYAMAFCRFVNGFVDRDVKLTRPTTTTDTANKDSDSDSSSSSSEVEPTNTSTPTTRQTGGHSTEKSMHAQARRVNLPACFVTLRHAATHNSMPSLTTWRTATTKALEWLYANWWAVHGMADPARAVSEDEEKARKIAEWRAGNRLKRASMLELEGEDRKQGDEDEERSLEMLREKTGLFHFSDEKLRRDYPTWPRRITIKKV